MFWFFFATFIFLPNILYPKMSVLKYFMNCFKNCLTQETSITLQLRDMVAIQWWNVLMKVVYFLVWTNYCLEKQGYGDYIVNPIVVCIDNRRSFITGLNPRLETAHINKPYNYDAVCTAVPDVARFFKNWPFILQSNGLM